MAIREGRWKCSFCGATNLGRFFATGCPRCGKEPGVGVRPYLPEGTPVVTDGELLELAKEGPNWICEHCGGNNRATQVNCEDCGAPRGSSPAVEVIEYDLDEIPRTAEEAREVREELGQTGQPDDFDTGADETPVSPARSRRARMRAPQLARADTNGFGWGGGAVGGLGLVLVALIALLLIGSLLFFVFRTHEEIVTVAGYQWERSIQVEKFKTLTQQSWKGELPSDARIQSSSLAIHHYQQVLDHYETKTRQVSERVQTGTRTYVCGSRDLGNGFFEDIECSEPVYETRYRTETYEEPVYRQEPVYRTRYTYEVERWAYERTERVGGASHEAYWPRFTLGINEREGGRSENYLVFFTNDQGKRYEYRCQTYAQWSSFDLYQKYKAKMNKLGIQEVELLDAIKR